MTTIIGMGMLAAAQVTPPASSLPPPPAIQFRRPNGQPLPEDVQRKLREQYRDALPPARPTTPSSDIVVNGRPPRGSVIGDIKPERTLSALDIRSYGTATVSELIQTLGAQVSSGRNDASADPIVLLNGRRVSSFAEIARLPTEAIERTEILPEEVALQYGYPADRKVVNVVAFERFTSRIVQGSIAGPTAGGQATTAGGAGYLRIHGDTRTMLDADVSRSSALLESERDVRQPSVGSPLGDYRTLLPATHRVTLNATVAANPLADVAATLNARVETSKTKALVGLGPDGVLRRDVDSATLHLGTTIAGRVHQWQWTATGNLDRTTNDSMTDTGVPATPQNLARFATLTANTDLLVNGSPFTLPAGAASLSLRSGVTTRDVSSRSQLGTSTRIGSLERDTASFQANIDLPIAGAATPSPMSIGALSANATVAAERLSDMGTLWTLGYGLHWTPLPRLSLLASVSDTRSAPTVEQLGAPLIIVPNVRTFDARRGETVDITRSFGSNPGLRADDRHVLSAGATFKPMARTDLIFTVDYIRTRIDDPIAAFPIALPQVEDAFPDRFTRDTMGRLQRIDATPINFARSNQQQIRWGLSFMRPLGPLPPGLQNANVRVFPSLEEAKRRLPPGARLETVEAGSPAARRVENLTSRLMLSLQHSWRLEDSVSLRPGGPVLDLLDGGALDARGGRPRHEVEFQASAFKRGLGARITATWQSGTSIRGSGAPAGDLKFGALATINLALFANVADQLGRSKAPSWLKGTRMTLGVTNIFDMRQSVRDGLGGTPLIYQNAYLNPVGRTVAFGLRKIL
ncbi:TonB-dependent receptor [Sphingomonas sp. gentR]|uniref:TonB-dependent receptor n=1 Tax=Sphingomonas sp. gentR TaxID=3118768 RepID=UPI001782EA00